MRISRLFALSIALTGLTGQYARANLVSNGSFGSGDFTGWTLSNSSISIDQSFTAPGDNYDASFSNSDLTPGAGTLSQVITTTAGTGYTLSFSLLDESSFFQDSFNVNFGGFFTTITGDTAETYQSEVFIIPGADITGLSTTLSFQGVNVLQGNWNLDDVSIVATGVPEPMTGPILAAGALMAFSLRSRKRVFKA